MSSRAAAGSPVLYESDLLDAARGGDEQAFRRLIELHRPVLLAHCCRMMGTLHDAEDATFAMPPYLGLRRGRAEIADSWLMPGGPAPRLPYERTWANAQPAVGTYLLYEQTGGYFPLGGLPERL